MQLKAPLPAEADLFSLHFPHSQPWKGATTSGSLGTSPEQSFSPQPGWQRQDSRSQEKTESRLQGEDLPPQLAVLQSPASSSSIPWDHQGQEQRARPRRGNQLCPPTPGAPMQSPLGLPSRKPGMPTAARKSKYLGRIIGHNPAGLVEGGFKFKNVRLSGEIWGASGLVVALKPRRVRWQHGRPQIGLGKSRKIIIRRMGRLRGLAIRWIVLLPWTGF